MPVTKLSEYKSRETVETLEKLLEQARRGEIHGLLFCVRLGIKSHAMGLAGEYAKDPVMAVAVTSRMLHRLNIYADENESAMSRPFVATGGGT